jgi:hypothetical protein
MRSIKGAFKSIIVITALAASLASVANAQNALQFTGVNATVENAIQLYWSSTNGELYQIQYANALATNDDGTTAWQVLYDKYPSHGTNTFIGDFGNYDTDSAISHPKYMPMRFYRVVDLGADNDTVDIPAVTITSPSNGSILSGQVTVSVAATCSNLPIVTTKLYVDGQAMDESDDGTNYVINTCEWPNGSHVVYAVATARSALSGRSGSFPISTSHGVTAYMPVTFSNLISRVAFSQPFFEPSLGQTQEVTATFAANCNWTLQIQDENSNVVRNASGSGGSMTFDWDGTGDGGTNIPDGYYIYLISTQTNGLALPSGLGGVGDGSSPPSPSFASAALSGGSDATQLWAQSPNGVVVPLALYPPGIDTNGFTIFEEALGWNPYQSSARSFAALDTPSGGAGPAYSGAASQGTAAPTRLPTAPAKNSVGTYGVAYVDWSTPQTVSIPKNGIPYPVTGVCHLDGGGTSVLFDPIPEGPAFEVNFIRTMKKGGWRLNYNKSNNSTPALHANDMRRSDQGYGGGELFTTANIGLFMNHGNYGTDPDYSAGSSGSRQTYFRISTDGGDNGWLRMCQIGFGGELKWLGILACNSLNTYSSMANAGAIPLKTTHLVCGCATIAAVGEDFGALWAKNMFGGVFTSPKTIANAWFQAGKTQYSYATNLTGTITFRVAGYPECMNDTIKNNTAPSSPSPAPGNLTQTPEQVYP